VLAEVSISLVLLVGAGLLFRSLMTLIDMPMGFTTSRMLTMSVAPTGENYRSPDQFLAYWDRVIDASARIPAWKGSRLTGYVPMGGGMSVLAFQPDNKPIVPFNQQPITNFVDIGPNYFSTMGIPIVRGREFTKQDATLDPRVIIINEAMARREFPNEDPIGHRSRSVPTTRATSSGSRLSAWSATCGSTGPIKSRCRSRMRRTTGAPVARAEPDASDDGDPMSIADRARGTQSLDPSLPVSPPRTLG
jgi:putative ABC transport system permease protein